MTKSIKTNYSDIKTKSGTIKAESRSSRKNEIQKVWQLEIDENTSDSLNSMKYGFIFFIGALLFTSCVSKKVLVEEQVRSSKFAKSLKICEDENLSLLNANRELSGKTMLLENQVANEQSKTNILDQQMNYYQSTNTNLLDRLTDLSVVSKTGAESIRKSLDAINDQNKYIKDLTSAMRAKDSLNLALVMKLKRSLVDVNDEDVTVEVKKGVVYISLSDKMLFKSGRYEINKDAEVVLSKIARVLNDHKQLEILVEGHTDNVPISTEVLADNWDLSVKRATSVVRLLQTKYGIAPERMTAGGRSEYIPKTANSTVEGKALNRRTEIIILPKLDEFFELLEPTTANN
ncbi:flagellar motor protein MotB [Draconibacterium sp.]|uniref:OmpA/MotB family protein n=1 Tax=Draconibacterium sp. TaxID=1965318 RepID=UPI00356868F1